MVLNRYTVRGSIVGTRRDLEEALSFAAEGKVKATIESQPLESINDVLARLKTGKVKELASALWEARPYRPDGIVNGADVWDRITKRQKPGLAYPWEGLTKMTYGQQPGTCNRIPDSKFRVRGRPGFHINGYGVKFRIVVDRSVERSGTGDNFYLQKRLAGSNHGC